MDLNSDEFFFGINKSLYKQFSIYIKQKIVRKIYLNLEKTNPNTNEYYFLITQKKIEKLIICFLLYFKTEEQKNELKKMDPEYITRTGTDFVLLPNSPEFINHNEPFEPMYIPKQTILEESLRREIERICFADTLLNKVVFDCSDPSPFNKDTDPNVYGLEVQCSHRRFLHKENVK